MSAVNILVHVGANYVPSCSPHVAAADIAAFLDELDEIAGGAKVSFSRVLPQVEHVVGNVNNGIVLLNSIVERSCRSVDVFFPPAFYPTRGHQELRFDHRLICKDGEHLSRMGVATLQKALENFCFHTFFH